MDLIIGGAFQGKTAYVKTHLGISDEEILDGSKAEAEQAKEARVINYFHLFLRKQFQQNHEKPMDDESLETLLHTVLSGKVEAIIMDEVGNGIIPIEASERAYRELVGKAGCILAREAKQVVRIVCGMEHVIK